MTDVAEHDQVALSAGPDLPAQLQPETVFDIRNLGVRYAGRLAVEGVTLAIPEGQIIALIGSSGCGKTSVLRTLNRMNDLIPGATMEGTVMYRGHDLYAKGVDPIVVRTVIGMVFQRPNPFPKSIYDNVAYGPRAHGIKKKTELDDIVERSLRQASIWEQVASRLGASAMDLSGGQQQRVCIARALANPTDVILMDEPCSSLDPIATARVEDVMVELVKPSDPSVRPRTIVIVTHNMQQAARIADKTAYMGVRVEPDGHRIGELIEFDDTNKIFTTPSDERTSNYVTGRTA